MQDVLLTVPDLYFCYEVAKTARRTWTTLATRNLHVGIFNSPHHPHPPRPPSSSESLPFESKAAEKCCSAPWLTGAEVARSPYSSIGELLVFVLCFWHNCSKKICRKSRWRRYSRVTDIISKRLILTCRVFDVCINRVTLLILLAVS